MKNFVLHSVLFVVVMFASQAQAEQFEWTLINQTRQTMTLVEDSLSHGQWVTKPPTQLTNNSHGAFIAESARGASSPVAGRLIYELDNKKRTRMVLTFIDPVVGHTSAGVSSAGRYVTRTTVNGDGSHATSLFEAVLGDCNEWFNVTVYNHTGFAMTVVSQTESHGKWVTSPSTTISNGSDNGWKAAGTCGSWTGVQGEVVYQINDGASTQVKVQFYKPYDGSGYYKTPMSGKSAGNYTVTSNGYDGSDNDHNTVYTHVSRATKPGSSDR